MRQLLTVYVYPALEEMIGTWATPIFRPLVYNMSSLTSMMDAPFLHQLESSAEGSPKFVPLRENGRG